MLVLGYAKATEAGDLAIQVPPFNSGHLGFVPGTPVRVGLVNESPEVPHREVVVRPFKKDTRDLALVTVAMRDRPGVVAQLVNAVAALRFNIEVLESASIKQLDKHSVTLLVQLSGTPGGKSADDLTPSPIRRLYQGYDSIFPVENLACVTLFESIVAHCADIIEWKSPIADKHFPEIEIRRYPDRRTESDFVVQPVVTEKGKKMHARIDLPDEIVNGLRPVVGPDGSFEYLLVSDTITRTLHAFFMQPELARRVFHVGFFHDDVPGALATILALLRTAKFNILTTLVRKEEKGRSVCEAIVQYQGEEEVPNGDVRQAHKPVTQGEIDWICEQIIAAHDKNGADVVDCAIRVAPPKYPPPKENVTAVSLGEQILPTSSGSGPTTPYEPAELLRDRLKELESGDRDDEDAEAAKQIVRLVQRRHKLRGKPGVFLSYPKSAAEHGEELWRRMEKKRRWRLVRYQQPDGEVMVEQVSAKIEDCEYFIGIWHHEETPSDGERTHSVSPWMLFEYGIAYNAGKGRIVVHSEMLHEDIWKRITPGVSNPEYSDVRFATKTVPLILEYCERHFV